MSGMARDIGTVVTFVRIEATEDDVVQMRAKNAKRLPIAGSSARNHPLSIHLGQHVASKIVIEVAKAQFIQPLLLCVQIGPMKFAKARKPPRRSGGEK